MGFYGPAGYPTGPGVVLWTGAALISAVTGVVATLEVH